MERQDLVHHIQALKKEKDAVIVAHYYVDEQVQAIADFVGDSYYLSKVCLERPEKMILFCGVKFMGESAKLLNPDKKVVMPAAHADCPMAHMIDVERIEEVRHQYEDLAVVCYINSTAEVKAHSDVCVTSSNAFKIISMLPQKNIFFIPDEHLGRYTAKQFPEKHFIFNDGFCHVHTSIKKEDVLRAKAAQPDAEIVVHPECPMEVSDLGDYVGSTAGIIDYITKSSSKKFIVCTEMGILYELKKKNPDKIFYSVGHRQFCPNMKLISLENIYEALRDEKNQVEIDEKIKGKAKDALIKMHQLGQ